MALFSSIIIVDRNYCILVAEYTSPISGKKRQIPSPIEFLRAVSDYYQTLPSWTGPRRATPQAPLYTPISSDQLPPGAWMDEVGRVGGMSDVDAGRLGGYMDEIGRVFVPEKVGKPPAAPQLPPPARSSADIPARTVQPTAIVTGVTPTGELDRSQSDEYKSQMAQYRNLIAKEKQQEAKDLGMEIWKQKYADTAMAQPGGAIGSYNPLLARMFPETRGYAGTFAPIEEIQKGDLGTRAQGEGGWTLESLNPEAQQEATAAQAQMATTAGMPVLSPRERAQLLIRSI